MSNLKVTVNPLFLIEGIICITLGVADLWLFMVMCSLCCEMVQALCIRTIEMTRMCVHFTPIVVKVEDVLPVFVDKMYKHFIGTGVAVFIGIMCFGFELNVYSKCAFAVAFVRLIPLLPFEGGKLVLDLIGKCFGTIKVASILTKIGMGYGYGLILFAMFTSLSFGGYFILFLPIGGYIVYSNKKILYPITKKMYQGLIMNGEKPVKEIIVKGTETPTQLSLYLNPYEEIFFSAKGKRAVSQQKVVVGVLENEGAEWLWKTAIIMD